MFLGMGLLTLPILVFLYRRENAKHERMQQDIVEKAVVLSADELRRMGDRAPDFRYML